MGDHKRLFFALWPSASVQTAIAKVTQTAGIRGKRVATNRIHLTLAFLGNVDSATVEQLRAEVAAIRAEAFDLTLARIGYFPKARIAWLGMEEPPAALMGLAEQIRQVAAGLELQTPTRRFRPHVTVARKAPHPPDRQLATPIAWPVRAFSLTESMQEQGEVVYQDLARWRLPRT